MGRAWPPVMGTRTDDRWLPLALGVLEMSAGALTLTPIPSQQALAAFAELARGLADRAPTWLRPWPTLELDGGAGDGPLAAVGIERAGHRVRLRSRPEHDGLEPRLVVEYYLDLVHDHWRACRVAARRPAGMIRLPAEEARLAEAFERVEPVLAGAAGVDRLLDLWEALAAPA
jgi:hypothetical protein